MNSDVAVSHRFFGNVSRDTKTKKQVFRRFCQDWWGGRGWLWGGQKRPPGSLVARTRIFLGRAGGRATVLLVKKGPWSRL